MIFSPLWVFSSLVQYLIVNGEYTLLCLESSYSFSAEKESQSKCHLFESLVAFLKILKIFKEEAKNADEKSRLSFFFKVFIYFFSAKFTTFFGLNGCKVKKQGRHVKG
jgi:hypothetical protein